jgi:hypothetical protein
MAISRQDKTKLKNKKDASQDFRGIRIAILNWREVMTSEVYVVI